ncbi:MAG: DUF1850 domain-containing protein, partial [Candidatus Caldatribacteriota bacterium]|nr:DUF1850 domain-containing protein [Candidatus Caldatribacteriota bacterium]
MKKKKNILIISGFILIIIALIMILFSKSIYTLELKTFDENKLIFKQRIFPGDEFTLKYTHSVAHTPVWEMFLINDQYQIILIETDFLDHGAGLPYTCFDEEIFIEEDNKFKIKNMSRVIYTPFYHRIGEIRENIFYFNDKVINLSSMLGDKLIILD